MERRREGARDPGARGRADRSPRAASRSRTPAGTPGRDPRPDPRSNAASLAGSTRAKHAASTTIRTPRRGWPGILKDLQIRTEPFTTP